MAPRPIFYDTETTGVKPDKDRIIEIAAYDPERKATFQRFVNPGCPIPPDATAIHKITDDMVADAPHYGIVGSEFLEFCSGDVILIAHNNDNFDLHFLRNEFQRHNLSWPSWNFLDTLKWARRYRPDLPRHTLQFLRELYEIPANQAHRALDDVMVLYEVFSRMTDDLTIEQAFQLLNAPQREKEIHHMPFGKHQGTPLKELPSHYVRWLAGSGALDKEENAALKRQFQKLGLLTGAAAVA